MPQHARHPMLEYLDALVGGWETEATHRLHPSTVVRGRAAFEWLAGGHFSCATGSGARGTRTARPARSCA